MQKPSNGPSNHQLWLFTLEEMGGQFWPPSYYEEDDMPVVGAKYPMMLYDGNRECIVHDEEDEKEAKEHGFYEHPAMKAAEKAAAAKPPEPKPEEPKPPEPPKPATQAQHPGQATVTTTRTVDVKPPQHQTAAPKKEK